MIHLRAGRRRLERSPAHKDLAIPHLRTPRLELLPATVAYLKADLEGRDALAQALALEVPVTWPPELFDDDGIRYMLTWLLDHPDDADWGLYYLVRRATPDTGRLLIGAGGFKGAPDADGAVEVGYSVLQEHQGLGYATEAVNGWVRFAFASERVTRVVGQTLPSLQPSIRVLERAGFRFVGAGDDPHAPAGEQVIRYELLRPTTGGQT